MADRLLRPEHVWMFGKKYDFNISASTTQLVAASYEQANGTPVTRQKNSIVLHTTGANASSTQTIQGWNTDHLSAHYVVELVHDRRDPGQPYADVCEVIPSNTWAYHAHHMNENSIGIEHTNVLWDWDKLQHDAFTGAGAARRPTDLNRWLHLPLSDLYAPTVANLTRPYQDFQAFQEEQYLAMLLLLRYLCIQHRIPRRFLGDNTREKMQRWLYNLHGSDVALLRSRLARFRGILSHLNCHETKICGGPAMNRNRLFRGIIDEWWMPIEPNGNERPYYMGPFRAPPNTASFVRFDNGTAVRELFHDAKLGPLQETRSYFSFNDVDHYTALAETVGLNGSFPVGTNRVWHGGIHIKPESRNPKVYAAASGTIVAARLGSDPATEASLGSQRFVLVRHAVYLAREPDPAGGQRTNYTAAPVRFFSLYMHLAPFVDLNNDNVANPPWYNVWLARHAGDDPNKVFSPNIEVSVGDVLGACGKFWRQTMLHFEIMSHDELLEAPWNNVQMRGYDPSTSAIMDPHVLEQFLGGQFPNGGNGVDPLLIAERFRNAKIFHKSEWALSGPDDFKPVLSGKKSREKEWDTARHFVWIKDAIAKYPDLRTELCDEQGLVWNYHPIIFMTHVNQLVDHENGELIEPDLRQTNVVMEDDFLTEFVTFAGGQAQRQSADAAALVPFDIPRLQGINVDYSFRREDVACRVRGPHGAIGTPPTSTHFHITVLDFIESVRRQSGHTLRMSLSHVCQTHHTHAHENACVVGGADALTAHANGFAADVAVNGATPAFCADVWRAATLLQSQFRTSCQSYSGEPSRPDLPEDVHQFNLFTTPAVQTKLLAGTPLTQPEATQFVLHVELVIITSYVTWECWLHKSSAATQVRLFDGGILGVFGSEADAQREGEQHNAWQKPWGWEAWIRRHSRAVSVKIYGGGIIGVYRTRDLAEAEKGADVAWAKP